MSVRRTTTVGRSATYSSGRPERSTPSAYRWNGLGRRGLAAVTVSDLVALRG